MRFQPKSKRNRWRRDSESGQALVLFVLCLPVLIGFAALVIDVGNFYAQKRFVQNAADAAVLAGAQNLPDATAAQAQAQSYVTKNGGGSVVVSFPETTKIRVRVTRSVSTYFAKVFALSHMNVAAQATTSRFAAGPNALIFARDTTDCAALKISGESNTFQGAVITDGGVDSAASSGGDLLIWNPALGSHCLTLHGGTRWAQVQALAPRDWPVPAPTLLPAPPLVPTTVNGVPCIQMGAKWNVTTVPPPGAFCATNSITIKCPGCTINNVAFIAPSIGWSSANGKVAGYQGIDSRYGGLIFYAYGAGGLNMSGSNNTWTSSIYVPNGNAQLSGKAGTVLTGFVEAKTVQVSGAGITWIGTGPAIGGSGGVSLTE